MKVGVSWVPSEPESYGTLAQATEAAGVSVIGVPDTQAGGYRECYSLLARVALATSTAQLGPVVTNPVTRHPMVSAAALATLHELSGGRAFAAIATGDTALSSIGMRPTSHATLAAYVSAIRDGLGSTDDQGQLRWATPLPIWLAADGPKTLTLAAGLGDTVLSGMGIALPVVQHSMTLVTTTNTREPTPKLYLSARCAIGDDIEALRVWIAPSLAAAANHVFAFSFEGKLVPPDLIEPISEMRQRYDIRHHTRFGENPNGSLIQELGLLDYFAERFAIIGSETECIAKLRDLKDLGIDGVFLRPLVADQREFLDRLGTVIAGVNTP